jgi:hypothetical protein
MRDATIVIPLGNGFSTTEGGGIDQNLLFV